MVGWGERRVDPTAASSDGPSGSSWSSPSGILGALALLVVVAVGASGWRSGAPEGTTDRTALAASSGVPRVAQPGAPAVGSVEPSGIGRRPGGGPAVPADGAAVPSAAPAPAVGELTAVAVGTRLRLSTGELVRLLGLDEHAVPPGQQCRAHTFETLLAAEVPAGTAVRVEADAAAPGGSYVTRVADGVLLNELLLAAGAAPAEAGRLDLRAALTRAAGDALANGRGVWGRCPGNVLPAGVELPPSAGG